MGMKTKTRPKRNEQLWPEAVVAAHWTRRVKKSIWSGARSPIVRRSHEKIPQDMTGCALKDLLRDVAIHISTGYPLTKVEYHLAIACGFLLTELPYVEFFTTRWHETNDHLTYGPGGPEHCHHCKLAAREKRKAKR